MFANIQKKSNIQKKTEKILLIASWRYIRHPTLFSPIIKTLIGENDVEPWRMAPIWLWLARWRKDWPSVFHILHL